MPAIGKPEFYLDAPCLEQELFIWESVALNKLKINKTGEDLKAAWIRGCIGDKGTQSLRKYKWAEGEWKNSDLVLHRFKDKIQPKYINQGKNIGLSLVISGKLQKLSQNSGLS